MEQDEIRIKTDNPNVTMVQRFGSGLLETLREIKSTTGEIDVTVDEIKKTVETITITRTIIQTN
ncbi:hypothetical protein [Flavobacterium sp.]|uniref:hypothetical protein n=1 Tax=Flavobacterium sp. TaxID=239 RepID=UPI00375371AE